MNSSYLSAMFGSAYAIMLSRLAHDANSEGNAEALGKCLILQLAYFFLLNLFIAQCHSTYISSIKTNGENCWVDNPSGRTRSGNS